MTDATLNRLLRQFVKSHGDQKNAAKVIGISEGYLSDILTGRRPPADCVLAVMHLERVVTVSYRKLKTA